MSEVGQAFRAPVNEFPIAGGKMGALVRAFDWSRTSLGPLSEWPQTLKTAVQMMLQSPVAIILLWGSDGVAIYNDSYSIFAGGNHPRLLGMPVLEGWPEVADFNRRVMDAGLSGNSLSFRDQHLVLTNRTGSPEDVWLNLDYSPIRNENGAPVGVLAIVYETTNQVHATLQLREREAELARVQQIGKIGGVEVDLRGGFRNRRSPEYLTLHGLPPEAVNETHEDWVNRIHPEDREFTVKHFLDAVAGDVRSYTTEYRIVRPSDGEVRWIAVSAEIERDADGRAIRLVGAHADITEREVATAELARLNATLEEQVEARTRERDRIWNVSQDLLLVTDRHGQFLSVNPAWSAILGWSREELLEKTARALEHPDDYPPTREAIIEVGDSGVLSRENRYQHKDGSYRWLSWTAVLDDGLWYVVGRDVTEARQAQEALKLAEEQLRHAQKMEAVGQLTGGIAHDFNNMLTGIIGGLDIVKRRLVAGRTDDVHRFIDAAVSSANRAAGLTHRLLAFSRRQTLDLKPVDINRQVASMQDMLARTLGEHIEIVIDPQPDLWIAKGDANQIETALLNLAINARDAMPEGGRLTIKTSNVSLSGGESRHRDALEPGDYIVMQVRDTGTGMTQGVRDRAFDPFFTTKPMGQGTGLGLSMVYGYAKQSHGHVQIDSSEGAGTTVSLYMPCYRGAETIGAAAALDVARQAGHSETVLVVEDDSAVRLTVVEVLRELGYQVLEAADDSAALPILDSGIQIDLLVTDVGLPGLNGRQIADYARQNRPKLKVLFITGYAEDASIRAGFLDPGMEMITKPFSVDILASRVQLMISRAS